MLLSYKYRLYPNKTQQQALGYALSIGRAIYNDALAQRKWYWERSRKHVHVYTLIKYYGALRKENPDEMGKIPFDSVSSLMLRLDKAYKAFFKRFKEGAGFPKFKNRKTFRSLDYQYGSGVKLLDNHLRLFKIGDVKIIMHRPLPQCKIKNVVVSEDAQGKWWACLQIELESRPVPTPQAECIGIDVGLAHLLSLSNGEFVDPPHLLEKHLKELRILQRKLDRQRRANNPNNYYEDGTVKKGARNWHISNHMADTQKAVAKLHGKIKEQRWYFWHTITDELTKRFSYIALEALTLDFMQQNGRISRRTQDAAIGMFWGMLKSKADERGVHLVWVNPRYTSQTCAQCGAVDAENRKTQAQFTCVSCGHEAQADVNAARNILRRALNGEVQPPAARNVDRRSSVNREV